MDVISAFIDDCFIALCIPSTKCGILWGASCIIINCCECVCKKMLHVEMKFRKKKSKNYI